MDFPVLSEKSERSWDHPLTTDKMRDCKNDWSLASDVGLLRHLQKFSEDITEKVEKTQTTLDELSSELNEASIMVDNVTNASLALANTQFIESRVREDDVENTCLKNTEKDKKNPRKEVNECNMIAAVSTSILQGLELMDKKFERLEMIPSSDSDDDGDNEVSVSSVILKPKDIYQNRALPYIIGSEKWKASSKIGLESSSSSESEMQEDEGEDDDEEDEEVEGDYSDSERDVELPERIFTFKKPHEITRSRFSSSTSTCGSSEYNEKSHEPNSQIDKIYTRSQDTLNSTSEIETITNQVVTKETSRKELPSFAEELAKRLGNVLPTSKQSDDNQCESDQTSINRSKEDDLFGSDDEENQSVFSYKSDNLFDNSNNLFDDKVSSSLWKDKSVKRPNIIPPSLDDPPPINSIETKPKSSIDDLFGDNDSDDSDDIFAPKNTWLSSKSSNKSAKNFESNKLNLGDVDRVNKMEKVITSTPEANNNVPNLFKDDDNDVNLFSSFDKSASRSTADTVKNQVRQVPGILINQSDLMSSTLGSKLFKRVNNDYSDSSENESIETENDRDNNLFNANENSTSAVNQSESMLDWNVQPDQVSNENSSVDSSGISIQPRSINSTFGGDWEPQMESTRLRSEEIYRERVVSDSMLTSRVNKTENTNSIGDIVGNQSEQSNPKSLSSTSSSLSSAGRNNHQEDLLDSDDVFGPPPLPRETSKIKSKVSSLFDDSDSGDDLFSNTSSGSRSQKSADQPAVASHQYNEKSKTTKSHGLFDEPLNLFSNNTSVPEIDIFTVESTSSSQSVSKKLLNKNTTVAGSDKNLSSKVSNLFDDDDEHDDYYLFGENIQKQSRIKMDNKEHNDMADSSKDTNKNIPKNESETNTSSSQIFENIDHKVDLKNTDNVHEPIAKSLVDKSKEKTMIDGPVVSKIKTAQISKDSTKLNPPKTLQIRLPNIADTDDSSQSSRRAVSGKIASLMGKMGDLKILSPTDTPPLWRKSGERPGTDEENSEYDSQDGNSVSVPKSSQSPKKDIETKNVITHPKTLSTIETETAVSFDYPAQPETLLVRSKSRAKITAKRRPQSRHARQSALRRSGIDFDSVDAVESSDIVEKLSSNKAPTIDDKSEMSLEKESSTSLTKNTLLSPSTDEEDLFDVPPDLPEDPQKEDSLFGHGPILSPFDLNDRDEFKQIEAKKNTFSNEKNIEKAKINTNEFNKNDDHKTDSLRNNSDDILKDPTQLFARAIKTPSPKKSNDEDDDILFSEAVKKEVSHSERKTIDLFAAEDDSSDLFSGPFTKQIGKKSIKTSKSLFDDGYSDEDEGDDLFGSASSKQSNLSKSNAEEATNNLSHLKTLPKKRKKKEGAVDHDINNIEDEVEEDLFFDASEKISAKILKPKLEDIFGDLKSVDDNDDDVFSTKKSIDTGLFAKDDCDNDKKTSSSSASNFESYGSVKKSITKDLRKTAESIVKDPLSTFNQDG